MKGLTFIEMIIALALVVILTLVAIPSFRRQASKTQDSIEQTQLLRLLQRAQQVANARMVSVAVCLSRDGKTCVATDGTMVMTFIDGYSDGALHDDSQRVNSAFLKGTGVMHLRAYPRYRNYILILPTIVNKSDNGTFWYCKDRSVQWAVSVGQSSEPQPIATPDPQLEC